MDALRGAGLTPVEQTIAVGANVLATLPGTTDRWVMVAAHDHLGKDGRGTPQDTPAWLDWAKIDATARWLERFVRETCARPEPRVAWIPGARLL
jgi:hypothetical protein